MKKAPAASVFVLLAVFATSAPSWAQRANEEVRVTRDGAVTFRLPLEDDAIRRQQVVALRERLQALLSPSQQAGAGGAGAEVSASSAAAPQAVAGHPGGSKMAVPLASMSFAVAQVGADGTFGAPACTELAGARAMLATRLDEEAK